MFSGLIQESLGAVLVDEPLEGEHAAEGDANIPEAGEVRHKGRGCPGVPCSDARRKAIRIGRL